MFFFILNYSSFSAENPWGRADSNSPLCFAHEAYRSTCCTHRLDKVGVSYTIETVSLQKAAKFSILQARYLQLARCFIRNKPSIVSRLLIGTYTDQSGNLIKETVPSGSGERKVLIPNLAALGVEHRIEFTSLTCSWRMKGSCHYIPYHFYRLSL